MKRINLTRKVLSLALAEKLGLLQRDAEKMVETIFSVMKETIIAGESVKLVQFGTLCVRDKSARRGRNPRTGEELLIGKRRTVSFYPSTRLRARINSED